MEGFIIHSIVFFTSLKATSNSVAFPDSMSMASVADDKVHLHCSTSLLYQRLMFMSTSLLVKFSEGLFDFWCFFPRPFLLSAFAIFLRARFFSHKDFCFIAWSRAPSTNPLRYSQVCPVVSPLIELIHWASLSEDRPLQTRPARSWSVPLAPVLQYSCPSIQWAPQRAQVLVSI